MGRIGEQSIPELANSEKARPCLQQGERKPDACADCRWYSLCRGGCKRGLGGERWQAGKLLLPCVQGIFCLCRSRILEIARAEAKILSEVGSRSFGGEVKARREKIKNE